LFTCVCLWGDEAKHLFNEQEILKTDSIVNQLKYIKETDKDIHAVKLGLLQYEGQGTICFDYSSSVFQKSLTIIYP
jgi:hypothetical protein